MFAGELQQFGRKFFGDRSRELLALNEFELASLFDHGLGNFGHAMPNEIHHRRRREIEIAFAVSVPEVNALAANGRWVRLTERAAQYRRAKVLMSQSRFTT